MQGYDFFEVSSAFQKSIRRGLEADAMYWAVELHESNFGEYVWKRMRVIASEDVGLAEPLIVLQVKALYENWKEQRKDDKISGKTSHRLYITHAVLLLCRAKKSRLVDYANIWHFRSHLLEKLPIPEWAYDKHTRKGKRFGRGLEHFFNEASKLENAVELDGELELRQKAWDILENPPKQPQKPNEQGDLF